MKLCLRDPHWPWLAVLAVFGASGSARAQQPPASMVEPRWLRLRFDEVSAGLYSEGRYEETTYRNSGTSATYERLFVGPLVGFKLNGSIYHPNLIDFLVDTEGSYGWGREIVRSTTTMNRHEMEYLGRFSGDATLLRREPYRTSVFANYDHSYRDYDFFSRVTADTWRYGARSGYTEGPVPVRVSYTHLDEEITGDLTPTVSHEDSVNLSAHNERASGGTDLNYNYDQYSRTDFGRAGVGTDQSVSLTDHETFGSQKQHRLWASATYLHRESAEDPSDQITSFANLRSEYRHNLDGFYNITYDHYDTDPVLSDNLIGRAELQHKLYESLTTTLIGEASDYEVSDQINSGYNRKFGGGISLGYTKRLGAQSRLYLGNSLRVDHVDQQNIGTVQNESHRFTTGGGGAPANSFFLDLPYVKQTTIVVSSLDANGGKIVPPWVRGLDYTVILVGVRTLIERPIGSRIPLNSVVVVDYQAEPTPPGSYESLTESAQVRLDFWENLWGIYARYNLFANNAPENLRVDSLSSVVFGTDVTWRFARAGAEYEIYDSTQSSFRSTRLFQSFQFNLDKASSLGINFSETWTEFLDPRRNEEDYRVISRYRLALSRHFSADMEAGAAYRHGTSEDPRVSYKVDQTVATVRPGFEWTIGRTTIKAGYEFTYDLYLHNEERFKQLFFLRARRVF